MCTTTRAKKVVVGLSLVALIAEAVNNACFHLCVTHVTDPVYVVILFIFVPIAILIINLIVVHKVCRRESSGAASSLGRHHHQSTSSQSAVPTVSLGRHHHQSTSSHYAVPTVSLGRHHHQSTSSHSAVPTVMLVTTSLIYFLLNGTWTIFYVVYESFSKDSSYTLYPEYEIVDALSFFIYAYNFYAYLIIGKQFRSELLALFCCCFSSFSFSSSSSFYFSSDAVVVTVVANDRV